jgi:hypothetical protein
MSAGPNDPANVADIRARYRAARARLRPGAPQRPAPATAADGDVEPPALNRHRSWLYALEEFNEDLRARFAIGRPPGTQLCGLVAAHFGLSPAELTGARGSRRVCAARQIAMYVLSHHLGLGTTEIGELFHRDHTTVSHAVRAVPARMARSTAVKDAVATIVERWRELGA